MEIMLFFLAALSFSIFVLTIVHLVRRVSYERVLHVDLSVLFIGIIYLLFSAILLLWGITYLNFEVLDFFIVYAIVLVAQMISLITILYTYNRNKNMLYTLLVLVLLLPLAFLSPAYLHLIVPFCLFVILLSFMIFSDTHQKTTALIIAYASLTILAYVITLIWPTLMLLLASLSTLMFLAFMRAFLNKLKHQNIPFRPEHKTKKEQNPIVHFLKHFIFIIIITNFIFIGTIGIHELGHLGASQLIGGCEGNKIVYEFNSLPHTQVDCEETAAKNIWILTGILLPILLSVLLFFGGGHAIKELALQILGISLIISYLDFQALGLSKALSAFILLLGGFLFILSLVLLAKTRTHH